MENINAKSLSSLCCSSSNSYGGALTATTFGSVINGNVEISNSTIDTFTRAFTSTSIKGGYLNLINVTGGDFASIASGGSRHTPVFSTPISVENIYLMNSNINVLTSGFYYASTNFVNLSGLNVNNDASSCFSDSTVKYMNGQNCTLMNANSFAMGSDLTTVEFQNSKITEMANAFSGH